MGYFVQEDLPACFNWYDVVDHMAGDRFETWKNLMRSRFGVRCKRWFFDGTAYVTGAHNQRKLWLPKGSTVAESFAWAKHLETKTS